MTAADLGASAWWWRLRWLEWLHAVNQRPARRIGLLLLWWIPSVFVPLASRLDPEATGRTLSLYSSFDVPLTLLLAMGVVVDARRHRSLPLVDAWLRSAVIHSRAARWCTLLHQLLIARWPLGLATATALLCIGGPAWTTGEAQQLLVMSVFGVLVGLMILWITVDQRRGARFNGPRRARALNALSWAAFHETVARLDSRRVALLAVPAMLAAPLDADVRSVLSLFLLYFPFVFLAMLCIECLRIQSTMHRFMPAGRLTAVQWTYWIWRHVAVMLAVVIAAWVVWTQHRWDTP